MSGPLVRSPGVVRELHLANVDGPTGQPCSPEHAYRCFLATNMDALVLEDFVLFKDQQPGAKQYAIDEYLAQFQLD